jgi:hypothetical protein
MQLPKRFGLYVAAIVDVLFDRRPYWAGWVTELF